MAGSSFARRSTTRPRSSRALSARRCRPSVVSFGCDRWAVGARLDVLDQTDIEPDMAGKSVTPVLPKVAVFSRLRASEALDSKRTLWVLCGLKYDSKMHIAYIYGRFFKPHLPSV